MDVKLNPINIEQKQELSNMLNEYLDILSSYAHEQFPKPYKHLDSYFIEPNRRPFFIQTNDKKVGFVLVNLKDPLANEEKQSISEFYVIPEYRDKGIGAEAARQVFDLFPGTWVIRELKSNSAEQFWKKVINNYTNGHYIEYEQNDEIRKCNVQEFSNIK